VRGPRRRDQRADLGLRRYRAAHDPLAVDRQGGRRHDPVGHDRGEVLHLDELGVIDAEVEHARFGERHQLLAVGAA
jgi:hypothetical protein